MKDLRAVRSEIILRQSAALNGASDPEDSAQTGAEKFPPDMPYFWFCANQIQTGSRNMEWVSSVSGNNGKLTTFGCKGIKV